jgi:2-keto-4-pentenoate hydratase/2-oxohepta-3-ene-1,7-dioic acid hydratase in catechol pathway
LSNQTNQYQIINKIRLSDWISSIKTILNDQERQNYPIADMIFPPAKLVSLISQDVPLQAGDIIACGTSVGVGSMKPGSNVTIIIEGVGRLDNRFE